jgi:Zn-dependent peptidase ImmA (M78 family)
MKADDDALMAAARKATEVLEEFEAKKRIEAGYTRIDAEQIASASNVVVMYRKLELLLGGFLREDGTPGIIVNWDRPRGLVHMTCAHELGHFALGHESSADTTVDISRNAALVERTANQFAYALLAPSWLVARTMRNQHWSRDSLHNPSVVYQMSLRLGMSYKAMVWSLNRLGHLTVLEALSIADVQPITLKHNLLGGAAPNNSRSDVWRLTDADRDNVLEPGLGDHMVFDLPNHAGSGRLWSVDEMRNEGFLLKPFVRDARSVSPRRNADITIGGDGLMLRYELTAPLEMLSPDEGGSEIVPTLGPRKKTISLSERAPWQPEHPPTDQLSLFAEFERLEDGLPQAERDRRLKNTRHD